MKQGIVIIDEWENNIRVEDIDPDDLDIIRETLIRSGDYCNKDWEQYRNSVKDLMVEMSRINVDGINLVVLGDEEARIDGCDHAVTVAVPENPDDLHTTRGIKAIPAIIGPVIICGINEEGDALIKLDNLRLERVLCNMFFSSKKNYGNLIRPALLCNWGWIH